MESAELKELRKRHGLTQKQMAEAIGVSENYVSKMERGASVITDDTATRLSEWDVRVTEPDKIPDGGFDPGNAPPITDDDTTPRRPAAAAATPRRLEGWQAEAAEQLTTYIRGAVFTVTLPDGSANQVTMPGMAHAVAWAWCPVCATILANASERIAATFVMAYPTLARRILAPGPQAELVIVMVTQVFIPCTMHHIHLGGHSEPDEESASNGATPQG